MVWADRTPLVGSPRELSGSVNLIMDGEKVGFGHHLIMISLVYQHRAIPIAWTWAEHVRDHSASSSNWPCRLYLKPFAPGCSRISGRWLRIWIRGNPKMAWFLTLVLRFASEIRYLWLAEPVQRVETFWQLYPWTRVETPTWPRKSDCQRDLPNLISAPLGGGRGSTLVHGH